MFPWGRVHCPRVCPPSGSAGDFSPVLCMTVLIRRLVLILCLSLWGGAAAAHAVLLSSDPAAEAVLEDVGAGERLVARDLPVSRLSKWLLRL